ncbi:Na+/H+ antiporter subunit E [Rhodomicrobium vannielii]|uniref:Na+/H+ antiporter subunit E n=1 Tax=Rhodomicrobium vannielii TaxID=1069 RepID=UPI00145E7EFB|nr:Na+/H+ antiporter subunit E [Rhodomicrobium vannielii]
MSKIIATIDKRAVLVRAPFFALLWWIMTGGDVASWLVGAPIVLVATLTSASMLSSSSWSLKGVFSFAAFFVWQSLRGGTDVALRAIDPRLPISPEVIEFPLRVPPGLLRVILANSACLLPGTLSVDLEGEVLKVHVLDGDSNPMAELKNLEWRVIQMGGASLRLQVDSDR